MGAVTFGIPKNLVILIKEHLFIETFIETGTFKGETSQWASRFFHTVYTIENSVELFVSSKEKLAKYQNIQCIYGNSHEILNVILAKLKEPAIFWLDAHWCGGATFGNNEICPLLDEIRLILQSGQNNVIMIDDARFFLKPPPRPQDTDLWPTLSDIMKLLISEVNYFTFVSEDVIVSLPSEGRHFLQPYFEAVHRREFPGSGVLRNLNFAARNIFSKYHH